MIYLTELVRNTIDQAPGLIVGGLVTWFVSKAYYVKASRDLVRASEELMSLIELNIQVQLATYESSNLIAPLRMANGKWTLRKLIGGTEPPADFYDDWNKYIESR